MWGICLDLLVCDGKLYQRAVEYEDSSDNCMAYILHPINDIKVSVEDIRPVDKSPVFTYGERVSPVNHPDITGRIADIIWHFKSNDYIYYISVSGIKKNKRYYSVDLLKSPD